VSDPRCCLWLDPGGTTGFSMVSLTPSGYLFSASQVRGTELAAEQVNAVLESHDTGTVHVGWERYLVASGGGKAGDPVPALEVIGAVKWLCHHYGAVVLPAVPASSRLVASVPLLKELGWYTPGRMHANDATRHLVAWLLRERVTRKKRL